MLYALIVTHTATAAHEVYCVTANTLKEQREARASLEGVAGEYPEGVFTHRYATIMSDNLGDIIQVQRLDAARTDAAVAGAGGNAKAYLGELVSILERYVQRC